MLYSKIGVIIADGCEYEPFLDRALEMGGEASILGGMDCVRFEIGPTKVVAVKCGMGKVNAAGATAFLADDGAQTFLSIGYSGGIHGAPRGSTAVSDRFIEHDFDLTPLGYEPAQKPDQEYIYDADEKVRDIIDRLYPGLPHGMMVTGDCFVCDSGLRDRLRDRYNAVSCDMETAAVAAIAHKCGLKAVAIRRISDDAGEDAKSTYREYTHIYDLPLTDILIEVIKKIAEA